MACESWQQLQSVLDREANLNSLQVSAAASHLVQLVGGRPILVSEAPQLHDFVQTTLIPRMEYSMPSFSPRQLASIAWALAKLGHVPPSWPWMTEWYSNVCRRLHTFNSRDLAQTLWACARLKSLSTPDSPAAGAEPSLQQQQQYQAAGTGRPSSFSPSLQWLEELSFEVAAQACNFSAQDVSNSLWAYAKLVGPLGRQSTGPVGTAVQQLLARAEELMALNCISTAAAPAPGIPGPSTAAATGNAEHSISHSDAAPRAARSSQGDDRRQRGFGSQELSTLAWACAMLKPAMQEARLGLLARALAAMHSPDPQHTALGLWALAAMRHKPEDATMRALAAHVAQQLRSAPYRVSNADIAQVLWALGVMMYRPPESVLAPLLDLIAQRMQRLQLREQVMILYGMARLGVRPGSGWLPRMCFLAASRWHLLPHAHAASMLSSLACMRVQPSEGFLDVAAGVAAAYGQRDSMLPEHSCPPHRPDLCGPAATCVLDSPDANVIASSLWALGTMAWAAPKWWSRRAAAALLRVLPALTPGQLVRALIGISGLVRQRPPRMYADQIISRLLQQAPGLDMGQLLAATHAMRKLQLSPSPELAKAYVIYCKQRTSSSSQEADRNVSSVASQAGLGLQSQGGSSVLTQQEQSMPQQGVMVEQSDDLCVKGMMQAREDRESLALALGAWLRVAQLGRARCGALEVWRLNRSRRLQKLQKLPA